MSVNITYFRHFLQQNAKFHARDAAVCCRFLLSSKSPFGLVRPHKHAIAASRLRREGCLDRYRQWGEAQKILSLVRLCGTCFNPFSSETHYNLELLRLLLCFPSSPDWRYKQLSIHLRRVIKRIQTDALKIVPGSRSCQNYVTKRVEESWSHVSNKFSQTRDVAFP